MFFVYRLIGHAWKHISHHKITMSFYKFLESFREMFQAKRHAWAWGALFLLSVMGMSDLPASSIIEGTAFARWLIVILIAICKTTLIVYVIYLCRKRRLLYTFFIILTFLYAFSCLVNFISYELYGFGLTVKLMTIISQTNQREFMEFIPVMCWDIFRVLGLPAFWISFLSAAGILYLTPRLICRKGAVNVLLAASATGFACLCFFIATLGYGRTALFMTLRTTANIYRCINDRKTIKKLENFRQPLPYSDKVTTDERAAIVILVIGESASRDHHSIYGYPLPTTPFLESILHDIFIFKDAVCSSTTTAQNIENILSFKSDNDTTLTWHDTPWLINLYKHAGYKTFWLSNQEKTGIWSNASAIMVSDADVIKYTGAENNSDHTLDKYDSSLLEPFDRVIRDPNGRKLICLHLMGSHMIYSKRYPPEYDIIGKDDVKSIADNKWMDGRKAATVAEYDNSIRFTDSILQHLIESASERKEPTILVYLSDHGEVVYDRRNFRGRDRTSVRVPFVIYANDAYRHKNPEIIKQLKESEKTKFSTSDAIHLLIGLTGISYPYYNKSKDIISGSYIPRTRYIDNTAWEYDNY